MYVIKPVTCYPTTLITSTGMYQGFIQDFEVGGGGGGEFRSLALHDVEGVLQHVSTRGVWGNCPPPPPPRKFLKNRCSEIDSEAFWRYL